LQEAHQRVDDHDGADGDRVGDLREDCRDHTGYQQEPDEGACELVGKDAQPGGTDLSNNLVGSGLVQGQLRFGAETACGPRRWSHRSVGEHGYLQRAAAVRGQ
jgi:hypothetical protein